MVIETGLLRKMLKLLIYVFFSSALFFSKMMNLKQKLAIYDTRHFTKIFVFTLSAMLAGRNSVHLSSNCCVTEMCAL